jgi:hypothetical protein
MPFDYSLSDPATTMKIDDDERGRDPQSTLPLSRQSPTTGRRLKLGTPRVTSSLATPTPQASAEAHPGFSLGKKQQVAESSSAGKPIVQPWILMVAGGALVLLVVALLLAPGRGSSAEGLANERLLTQYTKYLESKSLSNAVDIAERRKQALGRLQAVAWAKAVGDTAQLENELTALLFLDNDKSSPLYQYSVKQLKELGPAKKRAGI